MYFGLKEPAIKKTVGLSMVLYNESLILLYHIVNNAHGDWLVWQAIQF